MTGVDSHFQQIIEMGVITYLIAICRCDVDSIAEWIIRQKTDELLVPVMSLMSMHI